ncbi:hypothetical protein SDC9_87572 [bioreactor metagenome]|uniref:Uncharacterized protein n=1 Tax=bioreactor metagenome TaxID=1076179 RepID=A0A644ZQL5_9ZZZZ|nr:hypothetical protein [Paludibacter sp.]
MTQTTLSFLPKLSQKGLFIFAAIVWLISGAMLISKGFQFLPIEISFQYIKIPAAFVAGLLFYYFVFTRIMVKYTGHILSLPPAQKHPFYKVFRLRFYIMITIMISTGVITRKFSLVPIEYLALFYFTMGTPLLISAFGFLKMSKK